jgi:hypothetical protein
LSDVTSIFIIFVHLSVSLSAWNSSASTGRIFMKFEYFRKSVEKIQILLKPDNSGHFTWRQMYIYDHISLISSQNEKCFRQICRENQNKRFTSNKASFFSNRAFYEKLWKNSVEPGCPQMSLWYMRVSCWLPKATNSLSEFVIIINFL